MRITWRGLELPTRVQKDTEVSTDRYGRFFIEPFERGFGTTIGNSLRRILLSSLEGSAVESIKIQNVSHEFTSIPGVMEDVTDIILNVKRLVVRMQGDQKRTMKLSASKAGPVTAAMIACDPFIEIINKDLVLATLTEDVPFEMELIVGNGRGYSPAAERIAQADRAEQEIGRIEVDAIYSPVLRVRYKTEDTRVGQRTNYDKLVMEIWTNGTVIPEMALVEAGKILRKYINPIVQYEQLGKETVEEPVQAEPQQTKAVSEELAAKLAMPIEQLELTVRSSNCLESNNIRTIGQLVKMTEADLLKIRSFGKTSLREVQRKLDDLGLSLGMKDV
ncbi:MAG TPA: DNA-directed RNA polymerase subunit alpha [Anaerohalosphaeraceae bacterium]|jgi:DNA-directed RNA polymerase subunit alpha|nr:DNA-directed RNA polymerase subunit alpha [Anaerohalosphaeraceae bacterium]HPB91982.1 DNA-directed RNA polymerase subunit alpha [Anaerohalosphaeraceae bacterium]HRT22766.1 DNA-directed RNA polymerase subunit alpha [Anaerohalosphaeraceae bacterium]HRU14196.1 DNA-directed RNA polymerase subunit alpha [Anaerohalosphaeraceae bacterium]